MNPPEYFSPPPPSQVLLQKIKILFMFAKFKFRYYLSDQQFLPQDYEHMAGRNYNVRTCTTCQSGGL